MKKKIALEIICFLFTLLFTYAAISKLLDIENFTIQISQSPLLVDFAKLFAWVVPFVELAIASMLITNRFRQLGLYASFTLMTIFTSYIIAILNFSENIPCSCGGVLSQLGWTEHLIFNISFCLLGVGGIILYSITLKNDKSVVAT
jgi:uncharacterized membrane protein YphA (DoxX/SURF4 family)